MGLIAQQGAQQIEFGCVAAISSLFGIEGCQRKKTQCGNVNIGASVLADRNGLKKEYILYRTYCDYTHQSISAINESIDITSQGVTLDGDIKLTNFSESLAMLISITMISFPYISQHSLVDEKIKDQFVLLREKFGEVFEQK